MYCISSIIISTVLVIFFMGCDYLDGHKDEGMGIHAVVIASVSSDRPAEVVIGAYGEHHNTCVSGAKVYANRDGNKIYLTAKKEIPLGPGGCGDALATVYGEVTVKNLEVGEYIIMGDVPSIHHKDNELGRLRVESDAAYMQVKPTKMYADMHGKSLYRNTNKLDVILSPIVPGNGKLEDTVYHVKIMVDVVDFHIDMTKVFYKVPGCEAIYKADIERTENVINLDIWRQVRYPDSDCLIDSGIGISTLWLNATKAEIDIGTLSAGAYTVFIEGVEFYFDVSHTVY